MATIADLPYDLLSFIIILLVQSSSDGASQLAKLLSVCKTFLLLKQDLNILKVVRFDKSSKLPRLQGINSLVVQCAEVGNISAQFLLGEVILENLPQLLLVSDRASCICTLARNVNVQNTDICSFLSYFLPSEASRTRLVHYQLVKVFLLHCSEHEIISMIHHLRTYIHNFSRGTKEDMTTLLHSVDDLFLCASHIRGREKLIMLKEWLHSRQQLSTELKELHEKELRSKCHDDPSSSLTERYIRSNAMHCKLLCVEFRTVCKGTHVDWREAMNAGPRYLEDLLREAYIDFGACRDQMLVLFNLSFP